MGTKHYLLWRIWLVLVVLVTISAEVLDYYFPDPEMEAMSVFDYISSIFVIVAVYGYSFDKKFLVSTFWKFAFVFILFYDGYHFAQATLEMTSEDMDEMLADSGIFVFLIGFVTLMLLPGYIGTYLYSFRSPSIWNDHRNA